MLFGILKNAPTDREVSAVFRERAEEFLESLEGDPMPVPQNCLFLLDSNFHACLPPAVFATDIVFTAGAMLHWGWRECEHETMGDHRAIGIIAHEVGPVTRSCIVAFEKYGLMRPFGVVQKASHVFEAFGRLRLAGRDYHAGCRKLVS